MSDYTNDKSDACSAAVGDGGGEEQVVIGGSAVASGVTSACVLIAPWGQVHSSNGDFVMDEEAGLLVMQAFEVHGTDLPIDYEHQSLGGTYASPNGQAPAAGWIKALRVMRPGEGLGSGLKDVCDRPGLYAEVEWTAAAQERLAAREYRYLSPVVIVRKRDRRVVSLHSAALTNKPAIVGMQPIVNQERPGCKDEHAGMKEVESVILNESATAGEAVEVLRLRLGLDEQANTAEVVAAAEQRLAALEEEIRRREAEERVSAALRAGKLVAAQRDWALALAMNDAAAFDEWSQTAPVVIALGKTEPPNVKTGDRKRSLVIASAREAFRTTPGLSRLTSESAWLTQSLRTRDTSQRIRSKRGQGWSESSC